MTRLMKDSGKAHQISHKFAGTILLSVFLFAACGDSGVTSSDDDNMPPGNDGGNEIGSEPVFSNIRAIFEQNCGSCHIGGETSGVRLDSYTNVIESVGSQYGVKIVQPNNADGSPLIDKIEPDPQFGSRMPQGGSFLSQQRIDQIRTWINQGANNN